MATVAVVAVLSPSVVTTWRGAAPVVSAACSLCAGGEYHPVTPVRIFDSRVPINDVAPLGAKPIGNRTTATFDIQLLGLGDPNFVNAYLPPWVTPGDVLGVMASIAVVGPTIPGFLTAVPSGQVPPTLSSVLNYPAGRTVANLTLARPGESGRLTIGLNGGGTGGRAHVIVDVHGWVSSSSYVGEDGRESDDERGGRMISLANTRLFDSGATTALTVGPASVTTVKIRGATRLGTTTPPVVPDAPEVVAAVVNLTASRPSLNTFIAALPETPSGGISTSNLNIAAGETRAALAVVPVGADGSIRVYNNVGTVRLIVDVLGYVVVRGDETREGRLVPMSSPYRSFDTRGSQWGAAPLGPLQAERWSYASFSASVNISGISVGKIGSLFGNLTNASLGRQVATSPTTSFLTVYPYVPGGTLPLASNLNTTSEGSAVANALFVPLGTDLQVVTYNRAGYAHYLFDVSAVVLAD